MHAAHVRAACVHASSAYAGRAFAAQEAIEDLVHGSRYALALHVSVSCEAQTCKSCVRRCWNPCRIAQQPQGQGAGGVILK